MHRINKTTAAGQSSTRRHDESHVDLPASIRDKLTQMRRRKTLFAAGTTALVAAACLIVLASLAMLVDWHMAPASPTARSLLKWLPLATAVAVLAYGWRRHVLPGRRLSDIAREVDAKVPVLDERWSTLVGSGENDNSQWSTAMRHQVRAESTVLEPLVDPQQLIRPRWIRYATLAAGCALAFFALFFLSYWPWSPTLLRRFALPSSEISLTNVECRTAHAVTPVDEPFEVAALITGRLPESATLSIKNVDGSTDDIELEPVSDTSQDGTLDIRHQFRGPKESFAYQLAAGDGTSDWYQVDVVERPDLSEVNLQILSPRGDSIEQHAELPKRIRVHEGNLLQVAFRPTVSLKELKLRLGHDDERALSIDEDGWFRYETVLTESIQLSPRLTDQHGFNNRKTHFCRIDVVPDRPPSITVTSPTEKAMDVHPDGVLKLDFVANDDYGIAKAELVVYDESQRDPEGNPFALQIIDLDLGDQQDAKRIEQQLAIKLSDLGLSKDADVSLGIRVFDLKANTTRDSQPNGKRDAAAQTRPSASDGDERPSTSKTPPTQTAHSGGGSQRKDSPTSDNNESPRQTRSEPPATQNAQSDGQTPDSQPQPTETPTARDPDAKANGYAASRPRQASEPTPPNAASASHGATSDAKPTATSQSAQTGSRAVANSGSESGSPSSAAASSTDRPRSDKPDPAQIGQRTDSSRIAIVIDENAGRYDGSMQTDRRESIERELAEIESAIQSAKAMSEQALANRQQDGGPSVTNEPLLRDADQKLSDVEQSVGQLANAAQDTPYDSSSQQMIELAQSNVTPARELIVMSVESQSPEDLAEAIRLLNEAQQALRDVRQDYERTKMDQQLAESLHQIQKMYAIYLKDAFNLMGGSSAPSANRKPVEYDLDEEYLQRLAEIYEKRMQLMAEFARMLANDPRLLSRYTDFLERRSENLMSRLGELVEQQTTLRNEGRAWRRLQDSVKERFMQLIAYRRLAEATEIVREVDEFQGRYQAQLPLNLNLDQRDVAKSRSILSNMAETARTLPPDRQPDSKLNFADESVLRPKQDAADQIIDQIQEFESILLRIDGTTNDEQLSQFVELRFAELRDLTDRITAWASKLDPLSQRDYPRVAAVDQHAIYLKTNLFAGRIADLETLLRGVFEANNLEFPADLTEQVTELQSLISDKAAMYQLASIIGWREANVDEAWQQQTRAVNTLRKADRLLKEILRKVVAELDKLPAGPPPELVDPKLEDLLAMLERELNLEDELGIPPRPSNIMLMSPFATAGGQQMSMMRRQTRRNQRDLGRLLGSILNGNGKSKPKRRKSRHDVRWNTLVSELKNELRQQRGETPPEEYRQAIEQYFEQISKLVAEPTE